MTKNTDLTLKQASPTKLAHAVLRTKNHFDAMVAWYVDVLGARIVHNTGTIAFMTYDDEHHRVAISEDTTLADRVPRAVGVDHLAFTYASLGDLLATYSRLKSKGIMPFCCINHGPTHAIYYHDPDGNRLELQVDNFETVADSFAYMEGGFRDNPIGRGFDPDDYLRHLDAGRPERELLQPPRGGQVEPEVLAQLIAS